MTPSDNESSDRKDMKRRLVELRQEHRDLDLAIAAVDPDDRSSQMSIQRLKKRKLVLRDQITHLESALLPDIIA